MAEAWGPHVPMSCCTRWTRILSLWVLIEKQTEPCSLPDISLHMRPSMLMDMKMGYSNLLKDVVCAWRCWKLSGPIHGSRKNRHIAPVSGREK